MKADITRSTFNKNKKYTKVNAQQGRIQVDADWNEQLDIQEHFNKTILCDLVGKTGTPIEDNGFEISPTVGKAATPSFTIGKGRYYVDGIICENNSNNLDAQDQEDLLYSPLFEQLFADMIKKYSILSTVPSIGSKNYGYYVVYLDVWQRHITSLEDPDLQEVALGRTDTTTRTKNVWQVKTLLCDDIINAQKAIAEFERPIPCERGTLQVKLKESSDSDSSGGIPTGYSGDENRLYRVEIHSCEKGGSEQSVTFKWSKENAIVAAKISEVSVSEDISGSTSDSLLMSITIENSGKADDLYTSNDDQWIELTDDYHELWNIPGSMLLIDAVEAVPQENKSILKVKVKKDIEESSDPLLYHIVNKSVLINSDDNSDDKRVLKNPTVRRWDAFRTIADADMTKDAKYLDLDAGIQLRFDGGAYTRGDYWLIPARTITKNIEWPTDGDEPVALPSAMEHHYCSLALLHYFEDELAVVCDYRNFFPAGTSTALNFYYVSGDGQKITPKNVLLADPLLDVDLSDVDLSDVDSWVPLWLCVGAKIGAIAIEENFQDRFFVRFKIEDVNDDAVGLLVYENARGYVLPKDPNTDHYVDVHFEAGVAKCGWVFRPTAEWNKGTPNEVKFTPGKQRVSASLWKIGSGEDADSACLVAPVYFNATFAPPELRYVSDGPPEIDVDGNVFYDLAARLEVAGEPLCSIHQSLWNVHVRFEIVTADQAGILDPSGQSDRCIISEPVDGLVSCVWRLDATFPYQQVKAQLVDAINLLSRDRITFGSELFFKATLPSLSSNNADNLAISGVISLNFPSDSGVEPLISTSIFHTLNTGVPPAIILSLLPSTDSPVSNTLDVDSFDDFCLYNWVNTSLGRNSMFPRFKAVNVTKTSFQILMEPPYPQPNQTRYLRWWAIPAQPKDPQMGAVDLVKMGPRIEIKDSEGNDLSGYLSLSTTFVVKVLDTNKNTDNITVMLKIYPTSIGVAGCCMSEGIPLSRVDSKKSPDELGNIFEMSVTLTLIRITVTDNSKNPSVPVFSKSIDDDNYKDLSALLFSAEDLTMSFDYTYKPHPNFGDSTLTKRVIFRKSGKEADQALVANKPLASISTPQVSSEMTSADQGFIGSKTGKVFHLASCRSLPAEQNRVYFNSRQNAIDAGYTACSICKP